MHREEEIMKKHPAMVPANQLPIYERAIKRYPHLASIRDAMHFCQQLCRLAAVEGVSLREYNEIAKIANGAMMDVD